MTRIVLALGLVLTLANCGADGAPTPPGATAAATPAAGSTITVTGDAQIGISGQ